MNNQTKQSSLDWVHNHAKEISEILLLAVTIIIIFYAKEDQSLPLNMMKISNLKFEN